MGRIAPPIFTSVGRDGANSAGDVFVIQSLLNDRLPKPHSPVPVTGCRRCRHHPGDRGLPGRGHEDDAADPDASIRAAPPTIRSRPGRW